MTIILRVKYLFAVIIMVIFAVGKTNQMFNAMKTNDQKNRIASLDEVCQLPFPRPDIPEAVKQCTLNLANERGHILSAVKKYLGEDGMDTPIAEITGLLSSYVYVCGFIEKLASTDKDIADEAENYLPTFQGLSDTTHTINTLVKFLMEINSCQEYFDRYESELRLIQDITVQDINKTDNE